MSDRADSARIHERSRRKAGGHGFRLYDGHRFRRHDVMAPCLHN